MAPLHDSLVAYLAKPAGNGGTGNLLVNFAWIKANLLEAFGLGMIALAIGLLWQRKQNQGGKIVGTLILGLTAAFVVYAPWDKIGTMLGTNLPG